MPAQPTPGNGAESGAGPNPGAGEEANRAAIVVVGRDDATRQRIHRELARRYGTDYQIVTCDHPPGLAAQLRALRAAGTSVALVIGGIGAREPGRHWVLRRGPRV